MQTIQEKLALILKELLKDYSAIRNFLTTLSTEDAKEVFSAFKSEIYSDKHLGFHLLENTVDECRSVVRADNVDPLLVVFLKLLHELRGKGIASEEIKFFFSSQFNNKTFSEMIVDLCVEQNLDLLSRLPLDCLLDIFSTRIEKPLSVPSNILLNFAENLQNDKIENLKIFFDLLLSGLHKSPEGAERCFSLLEVKGGFSDIGFYLSQKALKNKNYLEILKDYLKIIGIAILNQPECAKSAASLLFESGITSLQEKSKLMLTRQSSFHIQGRLNFESQKEKGSLLKNIFLLNDQSIKKLLVQVLQHLSKNENSRAFSGELLYDFIVKLLPTNNLILSLLGTEELQQCVFHHILRLSTVEAVLAQCQQDGKGNFGRHGLNIFFTANGAKLMPEIKANDMPQVEELSAVIPNLSLSIVNAPQFSGKADSILTSPTGSINADVSPSLGRK